MRTVFGQASSSDRVNVAVVGFHGHGVNHYTAYAKMPMVRIVALRAVDEEITQ